MKKLGLFIAVLFFGGIALAQEKDGVTIRVTVENVLSDEGTLLGGLHTSETFMKGMGVGNAMASATKGAVTLTFENVQPGDYAIMVMHDKNDNKQMDFEANGMPKESYASSGEMSYGPPNFEASKFEVTDKDLEFTLRF